MTLCHLLIWAQLSSTSTKRPTESRKQTENSTLETQREEAQDEGEWEGIGEGEHDSKGHPGPARSPRVTQSNSVLKKRKPNAQRIQVEGPGLRPQADNAFESLADINGEPDSEEESDVTAWEPLHLSSEALLSLARLKFSNPTLIQKHAIPHILSGHDAICKAPTGSGKTLVFGIPIFEHWLKDRANQPLTETKHDKNRRPSPHALIISPTRELAHQLSSHLTEFSSGFAPFNPAIATVTGGLSMQKQQRLMTRADIIIGTPGRLWEVCGHFYLAAFSCLRGSHS